MDADPAGRSGPPPTATTVDPAPPRPHPLDEPLHALLREDGRPPLAELAARTGAGEPTVYRRRGLLTAGEGAVARRGLRVGPGPLVPCAERTLLDRVPGPSPRGGPQPAMVIVIGPETLVTPCGVAHCRRSGAV